MTELFITYDAVHQLADDAMRYPLREFRRRLARLRDWIDWGLV